MNKYIELVDSVVIITGAAQGIGRVIAREFALIGAKVVLVDINEEGRKVSDDLNSQGGNTLFIQADLVDKESISEIVNATINNFDTIDIIINNARPYLSNESFPDNLTDWDKGMSILLKAPALLAGYALPYLEKSKNASIINISSTNALTVSHQPLVYQVAKAALLHLTRCLSVELGAKKIRVNAICPGLVDQEDRERPLTSDIQNKYIVDRVVPLQRAADPKEIFELIAYLCSTSSSYLTGQAIILDGGMSSLDQFQSAKNVIEYKD